MRDCPTAMTRRHEMQKTARQMFGLSVTVVALAVMSSSHSWELPRQSTNRGDTAFVGSNASFLRVSRRGNSWVDTQSLSRERLALHGLVAADPRSTGSRQCKRQSGAHCHASFGDFLSQESRYTGIRPGGSLRRDVLRVPVQREFAAVSPLSATSVLLHDEPTSFGGRQPFTSRAVRWFISRCISSRARASAGLRVEVEARSNREAVRGRFDTVTVEFDELIFDNIQVTGGAKIEMLGVDFLTPGLLPGPMRRLRRFRRPCEVTCVGEFTDDDLIYSPSIRRLAERVVNAALRPRKPAKPPSSSPRDVDDDGGESPIANAYMGSSGIVNGGGGAEQRVHVFRVRVHGRKLAVEGELMSGPFFRVPFRYDISLSVSRSGHVLYLKDPSVYWGTPGGHVPLPMLPQLQAMKIDLGDRARIEHLRISSSRLAVAGRFILSPVAPLTVSRASKRANIEHDLAESLSRLVFNTLRFNRD